MNYGAQDFKNFGMLSQDEIESHPIYVKIRPSTSNSTTCSNNSYTFAAFSAIFALFGTIFLLSSNTISNHSSINILASNFKSKHTDDTDSTTTIFGDSIYSSTISFSLCRLGYECLPYFSNVQSDLYSYSHLEGYTAVIEPGAVMHLEVYDDDNSAVNRFSYTVCISDASQACQHGLKYDSMPKMATTINFQCTPGEIFNIVVVEYDSSDTELRTTSGKALCQYVRREIRDLSSADLDAFLETMLTLWSLSEEEGQSKYGEDFHTNSYLVKFHHFNAAWQDADHIHEGNGFLTQHVKMTNMFEKSIQSVNPYVTLPYWDFTIDHSQGKNAVESYVITSGTFGGMNLPNNIAWGFTSGEDITGGKIPDGKWSNLKAEMNDCFDDLRYGYGYMRAPWNMNPSPYISRFTYDYQIGVSLPTCSQHYAVLETSDNLMHFMLNMEDGPHATTHALIGGIYGCDLMKPLLEAGYITDETSLKQICGKWIFYMKEFYRANYIVPKSNCTLNEEDYGASVCGFTCDSSTNTALELNLKNKIASWVPSTMGSDGWTAWKDFICDGDGGRIYPGDHLESASPADPSFWVIHPTLERLLQARLMIGGYTDEIWGTDQTLSVSNDKGVCIKGECYDSTDGTRDYHASCCQGHFENDRLYDAINGDRTAFVGATNAEAMASLDPRSTDYSLGYIYDSFTWEHCSEDFDGLLRALKEERKNATSIPTIAPSIEPTFSPTPSVTEKPTKSPDYTHKPTHKPTKKPTHKPTHKPTKKSSDDDDDD